MKHNKSNIILLNVLLFLFLPFAIVLASPALSPIPAANMTYKGIYADQPVHLKKGVWQGKAFVSGAASRPRVGLIKNFSFSGDLDHDGQAEQMVFLWASSGGSGTQIYMAVNSYHNGHWTNIATALVGDRVQLQMGRVNQAKIELDVIQAGKGDQACCPTHHVLRSWVLKGSQLQEQTPLLLGQISINDLQGPKWQLVKLNWQEKIPAGEHISMQFNHNKVSGSSACNRFTSTVAEGKTAGQIRFGPIASSRMFCEPETMELETRFLKALKNVKSFGFINGYLTLEWQDGSAVSTMFFKPVH